MRLVCIADIHCTYDFPIPDGDILIVAGDLTWEGKLNEVAEAAMWLGGLRERFKHVVVVAGNHDWLFQRDQHTARLLLEEKGITYLHDQAVQLGGLEFWGTPWTPEFCNWAFNLPRGEQLRAKWALIPDTTQVLITHGPPRGFLDDVKREDFSGYGSYGEENLRRYTEHVGCEELTQRVRQLRQLRLHVFGHVHYAGLMFDSEGRRFCNASVVNHMYEYKFAPQVIDLPT